MRRRSELTLTFVVLVAVLLGLVAGCALGGGLSGEDKSAGDAQALFSFEDVAGKVLVLSSLDWMTYDPATEETKALEPNLPGIAKVRHRAQEGVLVLETTAGARYVAKEDGTELRKLEDTKTPIENIYPAPDLKGYAAFTAEAGQGTGGLEVFGLQADTRSAFGTVADAFLSWSPDSKRVYYSWRGKSHVTDTTGQEAETRALGNTVADISWFTDGNMFAEVEQPGGIGLAVLDSQGVIKEVLLSPAEAPKSQAYGQPLPELSHPSAAPTGDLVAFTAADSSEWQVGVINTGKPVPTLISPPRRGFEIATRPTRPVISPDRGKVAFIDGNYVDGYELYVVTLAEGEDPDPASVPIPFARATEDKPIPAEADPSLFEATILAWPPPKLGTDD